MNSLQHHHQQWWKSLDNDSKDIFSIELFPNIEIEDLNKTEIEQVYLNWLEKQQSNEK